MIKIMLSRKLGELRVTQADLARRTGIRPTTINEMYHELCDRVNLEYLDLICEVLDCDLDEILIRVPNEEDTSHGNHLLSQKAPLRVKPKAGANSFSTVGGKN